jgi:hypothetical protein
MLVVWLAVNLNIFVCIYICIYICICMSIYLCISVEQVRPQMGVTAPTKLSPAATWTQCTSPTIIRSRTVNIYLWGLHVHQRLFVGFCVAEIDFHAAETSMQALRLSAFPHRDGTFHPLNIHFSRSTPTRQPYLNHSMSRRIYIVHSLSTLAHPPVVHIFSTFCPLFIRSPRWRTWMTD